MIVKRPRILGGFLAQNPEFDSFSIDLIKEMLKSDVEKLSKANGRENTIRYRIIHINLSVAKTRNFVWT